MHGDIQLVIHRPLIGVLTTQSLVVISRALGAGAKVIVVLFPQLARGVALVIPRAVAVALGGTVTAKRGDLLFGRIALAIARQAHARLKVALGNRGVALVGARGNTAQVHVVLNNGDHGDGIVLTRAQIAGEMAASDFITALRQDAACKTARPSARYGDNAHVRSSIAIAFRR